MRLQDVATLEESAENTKLGGWMNKTPALIVNVQRQPGANVVDVVNRIQAMLPELKASLPSGVDVAVLTDRTTTIRASIRDVEFEMALAVALVVLVIFLFLRNIPATIIPSLSVPLSLIGTFAIMYLANFSLNNLSLMALTIATGFVVDDAIVMIENITRYIEAGDPPLEAALKGAGQIGFTIISLTVSLIAVLIPLLFMQDVVGRLFREFAVTLAVTIIISAVVSADARPHVVREVAEAHARRRERSPRRQQRLVRQAHRVVWPPADVGTGSPAPHADRRGCHAGDHRTVVLADSEGLLPRPGYGPHPGRLGGDRGGLLRGDGRAPAATGGGDPYGPGRARACPPSSAWTAITSR